MSPVPHHTPQPSHVSPASLQDGVGAPSKTRPRQLAHIPTTSQGGCHAHQPPLPKFLRGSKRLVYPTSSAHLMMKSNSEPANMRTPSRVETAPSITGAKVCSSAAAERTFLLPTAVRKPCMGWGCHAGLTPVCHL